MERERDQEQPQDLADAIEETTPEPGDHPDPSEKEEETKEDQVDPVMAAWDVNTKRPSDEMIEQWKGQFGDNIFMLALDEDEMYVWRPLTRHEYKQLLQEVQHEQAFMEQIVQRCVIWPSITPEWLAGGKGGTVPTLHGVIMEGSNFLAPEVAMSLVRKL